MYCEIKLPGFLSSVNKREERDGLLTYYNLGIVAPRLAVLIPVTTDQIKTQQQSYQQSREMNPA